MAQFKITSAPTFNRGDDQSDCFSVGEIVTVENVTPDSDGDVTAVGPSTDEEGRYIAMSCLTPIAEAGTVTVKVTPDLDDFAALLVEKIAASLEEAAKAIRGAASKEA